MINKYYLITSCFLIFLNVNISSCTFENVDQLYTPFDIVTIPDTLTQESSVYPIQDVIPFPQNIFVLVHLGENYRGYATII